MASEQAKAFVENEEQSASKGLLSEYSITPGTNLPMRTPRTPAMKDNILQVRMHYTILSHRFCLFQFISLRLPRKLNICSFLLFKHTHIYFYNFSVLFVLILVLSFCLGSAKHTLSSTSRHSIKRRSKHANV